MSSESLNEPPFIRLLSFVSRSGLGVLVATWVIRGSQVFAGRHFSESVQGQVEEPLVRLQSGRTKIFDRSLPRQGTEDRPSRVDGKGPLYERPTYREVEDRPRAAGPYPGTEDSGVTQGPVYPSPGTLRLRRNLPL